MYSFNSMLRKVPLTFLTENSDDVVGPELKESDLREGCYVFSVMQPLFSVAGHFKTRY